MIFFKEGCRRSQTTAYMISGPVYSNKNTVRQPICGPISLKYKLTHPDLSVFSNSDIRLLSSIDFPPLRNWTKKYS